MGGVKPEPFFVEREKVEEEEVEDLHVDVVVVDHEDDGDELNLNSMLDFVDHRGGGGDIDGGDQDLLVDVDDPSLFYGEFPALPDFQCMSSSMSSSSSITATVPPPSKSSSSGSSSVSSAASWAMLKTDDADDLVVAMDDVVVQQPPGFDRYGNMNGVDCMDVIDTFGYMDLIGGNEIWCGGGDDESDPSSFFENGLFQFSNDNDNNNNNNNNQSTESSQQALLQSQQQRGVVAVTETSGCSGGGGSGEISEDLAAVFFEWLKSNKESISADDLRNIRLKRSTIESAVKKLGGGKDGMKRLLKLILEWVQNHQLHNANTNYSQFLNLNNPNPNPNPNSSHQSYANAMAPPPDHQIHPWSFVSPQQPPFMATPRMVDTSASASAFSSMAGGYMGDQVMNYIQHENVYGSTTTGPVWPTQPQFTNSIPPLPPAAAAAQQCFRPPQYEDHQTTYQHFPGNGEKLVRLGSSATKEARQKRMARQRRLYSHHRHNQNHNQNAQSHQQNQQQLMNQIGNDTSSASDQSAAPLNWVYWPSGTGPSSHHVMPVQPEFSVPSQSSVRHVAMIPQSQNHLRQDQKRQGWKREKNLRFLLQKVLKQSDVGNLGRIVLPKKEAETHLPELDARDGISIPMEDIGTSRIWNMRYRFWPNNKSRMYLLENTGDFVRANGLQEGDFIVIYSDMKCGKYLIRGVKVRQSAPKTETKKSGKCHKTQQHDRHGVPSKTGNGHAVSSSQAGKQNTNNEKNDNCNYDENKRNEKKQMLHADGMRIDGSVCG